MDTFVYFANETSPEGPEKQNYETLSSWLKEINTEKSLLVLKNISADQIKFPTSVKNELDALTNFKANVYVFTNALARKNAFLIKGKNTNSFTSEKFDFELKTQNNPVLQSNPLSDYESVRRILGWLSEKISSDPELSLGLLFKSHGNNEMALTPRVSIWTSSMTKDRLEQILKDPTLVESNDRPGISRRQFMGLISKFQKQLKQKIDFIVLQSCGASPSISEYKIGKNIQSFFSNSTEKAEYDEINYRKAIQLNPDKPIESFLSYLRSHPQFKEYKAVDSFTEFKRSVWYFIPLFILFLWSAIRRQRRAREKSR